MNFLDPVNVLEKIVPEQKADKATSWRSSRGRQSEAVCSRVLRKMFPTRRHHLTMATGLLAASVLLFIAGCTLNYDLCVRVSSSLEVIDRYVQPSDRYSGFPQVIADLMATFLAFIAIFCFYRWSSYPKVPAGIKKSIDHVNTEPPARVQVICKTFFISLINMEIENFLIYFFLMAFFIFLAVTDVYLPETIFWPQSPDDIQSMEVPTICFIGFGIFGWFKPMIIVIVGGFAAMCVVSAINLYEDYLHLKGNDKIPVAGITEHVHGENYAILLNARFSNQNSIDRTSQRLKGMESFYVPAVEELNNCDIVASDLKTV